MKATLMSNELGTRAKEALTAVLHQVSTIEMKGMEAKAPEASRQMDFVVHIGVLGRDHTLNCKVTTSGEARAVRKALRELQEETAHLPGDTTPVFIAPSLSAESRALCIETKTGFVDLEDNARLVLGEVFIGKRSLPRREQPKMVMPQTADTLDMQKFLPLRVGTPVADFAVPVISAA
ncbi:MAG TPA: hypothetical protein VGR47_06155 [Terracidiphilus sp.]|nr:hypothetical protein [Terracidiphilus sp.]